MQLNIDGERPIAEVQKDFSFAYPYLKIEFFRNGAVRKHRYPAHLKIASHLRLKDAWIYKKPHGVLDINDSMAVQDLENAFLDEFGLSVQVFRKSGNIWLETTMTDNWTLKQQSDHGMEISRGIKSYNQRDNDYGLDRDS